MSLVRELGASHLTGYLLTAMIHAEGSEAASKIGMLREYDYREAEKLINKILNKLKLNRDLNHNMQNTAQFY